MSNPISTSNVSRETLEKLKLYESVLVKWQPRVNLVSTSTLPDVWVRHFEDSLQLIPLIPESSDTIFDLGSGAGLPGMVLAISGYKNVTLVESDLKKCSFLRDVSRETSTPVTVLSERIESLDQGTAKIITARGLAKLSKILEDSKGLRNPSTRYLLLKGEQVEMEIGEALKYWSFDHNLHQSSTDPRGRILELWNVNKKEL